MKTQARLFDQLALVPHRGVLPHRPIVRPPPSALPLAAPPEWALLVTEERAALRIIMRALIKAREPQTPAADNA